MEPKHIMTLIMGTPIKGPQFWNPHIEQWLHGLGWESPRAALGVYVYMHIHCCLRGECMEASPGGYHMYIYIYIHIHLSLYIYICMFFSFR